MRMREPFEMARWLWIGLVLAVLHACGTQANGGNSESHFLHEGGSVPRDSGFRTDAGSGDSRAPTDAAGAVQCPSQFPSFNRTCATSADCTLVRHQVDCCGSESYLAIVAAEGQRFADTEAACVSRFPLCFCPPGIAPLDDGTTVSDIKDAIAECVQGECRSRLNAPTFPCGDKNCTEQEFCLVSGSVDPLAPDSGARAYKCTASPSCVASCDSNPCVFPGCGCFVTGGHVAIGCESKISNGSTCDDLSGAAERAIGLDAFTMAAADLSCGSDADCVIQFSTADCTSGCPSAVVSTRGMETVETAIDYVNLGICPQFASKGCAVPRPPCPLPPTNAACVNGACVDFPPAAWLSFTVDEARGSDATNPPIPVNCSAGQNCTLWRFFPNGSIQKYTAGTLSTSTLSPADFSTVDGILRSQSFRQIYASGGPTSCPTPPSGIAVLLELQNGFWVNAYDFTGCALVGPAGNDAMTLYDLVRKY